MEPFGLFQILQNLLASQGEKSSETGAVSNEPEPPRREPHPPQKEEKTESLPLKNAAAEFLEEHDRRAKKIRR